MSASRLIVLFVLLTGCAVSRVTLDVPVILAELPNNILAQTRCAFNNLPFVVFSDTTRTPDEGTLVHEKKHVEQSRMKGGCKAFTQRYRTDSTFRIKTEFEAYCAEAQFWLTRGHHPVVLWERVVLVMREQFNVTPFNNCVYE